MGAPAGSTEVVNVTCPALTGRLASSSPVNVRVAGPFTECFLIRAQASGSGFQVCAAACSGVRNGGLFAAETQSGSIAEIFIPSPEEVRWIALRRSAKVTSTRQECAELSASRQRNVGATISGGKIAPSWG